MKDEFELMLELDGTIQTVYQDGLDELANGMGADLAQVCRASNIEWEDLGHNKGWVIRAAHDPTLAIRYVAPDICGCIGVSREGAEVTFPSREEAIKVELKHFWELLEKENGTEVRSGKSNI